VHVIEETMIKPEIRAQMRAFLKAMSPDERQRRSTAACARVAATREFKNAQMVMLFLSMPSEIETSALALKAWQECKSIAVPRVDWESRRMDPLEIRSLETGFQTVAPGYRQPIEGTVVPLDLIDMVVIPGLAFDRKGFRVGRGRGFYDRFLSQQDFKGVRCALCYHEQILNEDIPREPHDIPMDLIVTDEELIRCPAPVPAREER
jgi:5-formyltetrahydrofolate cyclo-ligase